MGSFRVDSLCMDSFRINSFRKGSFLREEIRRATLGTGSSSGVGLNFMVLFAGRNISYKSSFVSIFTIVLHK